MTCPYCHATHDVGHLDRTPCPIKTVLDAAKGAK